MPRRGGIAGADDRRNVGQLVEVLLDLHRNRVELFGAGLRPFGNRLARSNVGSRGDGGARFVRECLGGLLDGFPGSDRRQAAWQRRDRRHDHQRLKRQRAECSFGVGLVLDVCGSRLDRSNRRRSR